jgi:hypothetical protein
VRRGERVAGERKRRMREKEHRGRCMTSPMRMHTCMHIIYGFLKDPRKFVSGLQHLRERERERERDHDDDDDDDDDDKGLAMRAG